MKKEIFFLFNVNDGKIQIVRRDYSLHLKNADEWAIISNELSEHFLDLFGNTIRVINEKVAESRSYYLHVTDWAKEGVKSDEKPMTFNEWFKHEFGFGFPQPSSDTLKYVLCDLNNECVGYADKKYILNLKDKENWGIIIDACPESIQDVFGDSIRITTNQEMRERYDYIGRRMIKDKRVKSFDKWLLSKEKKQQQRSATINEMFAQERELQPPF